jgi:hypothetical protein
MDHEQEIPRLGQSTAIGPETPAAPVSDLELDRVAAELRNMDPDGLRTGQVLRDTFDQLYDGQHRGRYRFDQLYKTEKTYCGTLVEINLQREFNFKDGTKLDYRIADVEVDCKYSQDLAAWMIPPEAEGHLCLGLWAADTADPKWSMGLVRITADRLGAKNRDGKASLNKAGKASIRWLFSKAKLPPNVLLQLDDTTVQRIFKPKFGTRRINELFRNALGMRVGRAVVATVGQQEDYMKRIRENGGARSALRPEGIIILGQYGSHAAIASALGVPIPGPGESVSVRVVPAEGPAIGVARIKGGFWRVAQAGDDVVAAPVLPEIKKKRNR